ncbi:MAG TPA: hypothetical protein VIH87_13025 [Methylocella sp.]
MQIAVLGIDLGKNSCNQVGLDGQGTVVKRRLRLLIKSNLYRTGSVNTPHRTGSVNTPHARTVVRNPFGVRHF